MASTVTLRSNQRFPVGQSVGAYLETARNDGAAPTGAAVETQTVAADGSLTFTTLTDNARYVAYAQVGGVHTYVRFTAAPVNPTVVASTTAGVTDCNGTVAPAIPANANDAYGDDLLYLFVSVRTSNDPGAGAVATPDGWALLDSKPRGTAGRGWLFRRIAAGASAPSITTTGLSGTGPLQASITRVPGGDDEYPDDAELGATASGTSVPTLPAVTATRDNGLALYFINAGAVGAAGAYSWTGATEVLDFATADNAAANVGSHSVAFAPLGAKGPAPTPTATYSAGVGTHVMFTVAVAPQVHRRAKNRRPK